MDLTVYELLNYPASCGLIMCSEVNALFTNENQIL